MIGHNVNMLMPEPHRSRHDGYRKTRRDTGVPRTIGIGREVKGRRQAWVESRTSSVSLLDTLKQFTDKPARKPGGPTA